MRLIDADALIDKYQQENGVDLYRYNVIQDLVDAPTVDAVPARHGRWIITGTKNIYGGTLIECSECHDRVMVQHIADEMYCRHCGAKMEVEHETD